jgi:C4-dicarboxylate-specific signal transduction histidine kinase
LERAVARGDASAQVALDGLARVLANDEQFVQEYECPSPEQPVRWFRMSAFPLRPPARGAIVMHWDVTERKLSELAVRRERDRLADVQRLSTMSELATSIAHELNQPLAAIMASASTLRRQLKLDDRWGLQSTIDDIIASTARAAEVMRRARSMVRGDSGMRESVTLNEIVDAVTRLLASDLVIQQVTLTTSLGDSLPPIVGDRIQLQQVLLNLLLNAIDAVHDQPRERRMVHVATSRAEADVVITVSDTGAGLAPEIVDRVFDPFATTKPDGTGLGLSIVRAIVEAHAGRVWVESTTEGGAAFRVSLPC